ncbi:MAG: toll/interleukin-1 receptor domain-containing protein [bacterium]|nr:toll/interleukin-1 receptor domain-containing protein [bacterium]
MGGKMPEKEYDVFISHASEDKELFVRPLAATLQTLGVQIWYDEFSLSIGDSLSRSIDKGLLESRYGVVVVSPDFIKKSWPEYELRGLVALEHSRDSEILPVWHNVTRADVLGFSPSLADKFAVDSAREGAKGTALVILRKVRPDIYEKLSQEEIETQVSGSALQILQQELEKTRNQLNNTSEELSEYRCPRCGSAVENRVEAPVGGDYGDTDLREIFECGHVLFGGHTERPCPEDQRFPALSDWDLECREEGGRWFCRAKPRTKWARSVSLMEGHGTSEEAARNDLANWYKKLKNPPCSQST